MILDTAMFNWFRRQRTEVTEAASSRRLASLRRESPLVAEAGRHVRGGQLPIGGGGAEAGFTLIELMVVLLILAILLAIAIPTFLGVTKSANDRAAQSNLNTAFVNAKAAFQQNSQAYATSTSLTAALSTAEPSLTFSTGTLTTANAQSTVSVNTSSDGTSLVMAVLSKSTNNCWYLVDNTKTESTTLWSATASTFSPASGSTAASGAGFPYQPGTWYGEVKAAASCGATVVPGTEPTAVLFQSTNGFPSL